MTKKQIMLKLSAYKVVLAMLALVILAGAGLVVKAKSYFDWGSVEEKVAQSIVDGMDLEAPVEEELGALSGPDVYSYLKVHGRFQQGGYMVAVTNASTTVATTTITASQVWTYSGVDYTPSVLATDIVLPATSTLTFLASPGDCVEWRFRNLSSTSATSTTFVAGSGMDLIENENGDVVIEGGNEAQLRFCRELDEGVTVYVDEYVAAD